MFDANFWVLVTISLIFTLMGLFVFGRNPLSALNRTFLYFVLSVALWVWTNILFQLVTDNLAFPIALASYFAASLIAVYILRFSLLLTNYKPHTSLLALGWGFSLATMIPGFLATSVVNHTINTTPWLILYAVFLLGHFLVTTIILIIFTRRSSGLQRRRTSTVLIGLALSFIGGSFFNLFLPLFGNYSFVELGPVMSTPLIIAMALAIAKQQLFDIRFALARTAAYLLLLFSLCIIYAGAIFVIISLFFGDQEQINSSKNLVYLLVAVFLALTFDPLKRFFNKVTDRIFFHHGLDTQEVLNKLSNIIVDEIDLSRASRRSLRLLSDVIKPESASLYVLSKDKADVYAFHLNHLSSGSQDADKQIFNVFDLKNQDTIIVKDELDDSYKELKTLMDAAHRSIVIRLQASHEAVGYLLFGAKQNGSIYNTRDISLLMAVVGELTLALQNSLRFYEILNFNQTLKQEIAEATAQLRITNRKLRRLDEIKDEFISMASHQLRTPLTSVKGYISMVLEGDAGEVTPQQRQLLEEAFTSAQRMVYLIGDFLNVSRLQTGRFIIEWKPTNLAQLIQDEVAQLQETANRRDIKINFKMPVDFPQLFIDENKVRQVIMNFIDNAIFYSKPGGKITITLLAQAQQIEFKVQDTGIGVPAAERPKLFTKFFRAENARRARPDGTGVGLFMAKKVVAAHGGSIIFDSKEGKGSTFGFSLPNRLKDKPGQLVDNIAEDKS